MESAGAACRLHPPHPQQEEQQQPDRPHVCPLLPPPSTCTSTKCVVCTLARVRQPTRICSIGCSEPRTAAAADCQFSVLSLGVPGGPYPAARPSPRCDSEPAMIRRTVGPCDCPGLEPCSVRSGPGGGAAPCRSTAACGSVRGPAAGAAQAQAGHFRLQAKVPATRPVSALPQWAAVTRPSLISRSAIAPTFTVAGQGGTGRALSEALAALTGSEGPGHRPGGAHWLRAAPRPPGPGRCQGTESSRDRPVGNHWEI
eukprot:763834-Hanusia_phi.AAC.2